MDEICVEVGFDTHELRIVELYKLSGDLPKKTLDQIKGDVNYCMTKLLVTLKEKYGESYTVLSAIVGIPRDVEAEFRKKHMRRYEDKKEKENGTILPLKVEK